MSSTRVLVTGSDGFIGSHLVERLVEDGHSVTALCLYNSNASAGWLDQSPVRGDVDVRLGDIRDGEFVTALCSDVDLVVHLAALIAIPYSYEAPRSFVDTNIGGTLNVLEGVRRHDTRLIAASTSEVYGTPDTVPISESHALKGQSPYSASKIAADQLCFAYARSFDLDVAVLRPFNTYGPRQSMRAVIPVILSQLLAGAKTIRLGALEPKRDFTFVSDTVDAFARAISRPLAAGTVTQLGTGSTISIGDLFSACCRAVGVTAEVEQDPQRIRPPGSEVEILLSDPSRAKDVLGWEARTPLEFGLSRTAEWLRSRDLSSLVGTYVK